MAVLRALGFDCSAYLGKTFVLPQCDADLAILVPLVLGGRDGAAAVWPRVRSSGGVATPRSRSSWGIIA